MFDKHKLPQEFVQALVKQQALCIQPSSFAKGIVGIELELEGKGVQENLIPVFNEGNNWQYHNDGTLDATGAEFVFHRPVGWEQAKAQVKGFYNTIKGLSNVELKLSQRCSTHVHVNVAEFTINQLLLFLTIYYCYEDLLIKVMAPERYNSRFCLRATECDGIMQALLKDLQGERLRGVLNGERKYAACNLAAMHKFGTLEFRALGGTDNPDKLIKWLNAIEELWNYTKVNPKLTPDAFMGRFSGNSFFMFTMNNFPVISSIVVNEKDFAHALDHSVWCAQNLAYGFDYSEVHSEAPLKKERAVDPRKAPLPQGRGIDGRFGNVQVKVRNDFDLEDEF